MALPRTTLSAYAIKNEGMDPVKLGERLLALRKQNGLTQAEAADMLGLSLSAHNRYEYGKREPTASVLIRMADLYGVTIDYLVGRTDEP